jgi:hypothetical protein
MPLHATEAGLAVDAVVGVADVDLEDAFAGAEAPDPRAHSDHGRLHPRTAPSHANLERL